MKKSLGLILLILLLTSCRVSNSIEGNVNTETASVTTMVTEKSETTPVFSVSATESSTQTTASVETTTLETTTLATIPEQMAETAATTGTVETSEAIELPLVSAYTDKSNYKNDEIVSFNIKLDSDTTLWLDPYCDFEFFNGTDWIKQYTVLDSLGPGEVAIGITKGL